MRTILIIIVTMLASTFAAYSHTAIKTSNIESGKTYESAPETLHLSFDAPVGLVELKLETSDSREIDVDYELPKSMQKEFHVKLPELESGAYIIRWRTMSSDGHVMNGEIPFVIQ